MRTSCFIDEADANGIVLPPTETITFKWSRQYGDCYDCALPAAFYVPDAYGPVNEMGEEHKRCAVCAANDAVNGERVIRIDGEVI